jgi:hypothetical protein
MNKAIQSDMAKARVTESGRKPSKKGAIARSLSRPDVISDISQGIIVSEMPDSFSPVKSPMIGQQVRIKGSNGMYVYVTDDTKYLWCDNTQSNATLFTVKDAGNNAINLVAPSGKFVSRALATSDGTNSNMIADRDTAGGWETFFWFDNADGTFSLAGDNGGFMTSGGANAPMSMNATSIGTDQTFTFETKDGTTSTQIAQAAASSGGSSTSGMTGFSKKYWWLWYVLAIVAIIIYIKFVKK